MILGGSRYVVLDDSLEGLRSDILFGLPEGARSLDKLVVIKRFHAEPAEAERIGLLAELEGVSLLDHDNVVRTFDVGREAGRCFMINEYLDGAPLQACLQGLATARHRMPDAVVARILRAMVDAVVHAQRRAQSLASLALGLGAVAADDVFLCYDGRVKLLGFKRHVDLLEPRTVTSMAIDALFEPHVTPGMRISLRRIAIQAQPDGSELGRAVRDILGRPCREDPLGDGRVELERVMRQVERLTRARQALRLASAFARLDNQRARRCIGDETEPPTSGLRRVHVRGGADGEPRSVVVHADVYSGPFDVVRAQRGRWRDLRDGALSQSMPRSTRGPRPATS
jgi:hypothetical protein